MNFQQLKIVREAARQDFNLTEVANALFTSQSGVSRHIRELEDELGVELYIRHGKRLLGMTEPGKELLVIAERILNDVNSIRKLADSFARREQGRLHVTTTHALARYTLSQAVAGFRSRFPQVQLAIEQATPDDIVACLLNGQTDIGIASARLDTAEGIVTFPYYRWHQDIVVPAAHPLTQEAVLTLEKLASWPLVTYPEGSSGRTGVDEAFAEAGIQPDILLTAQDSEAIKTYVELGQGVGIIADLAFDPRRDQGLVALDASHLFAERTAWIGLKKELYQHNFAWSFVQQCNPELSISDIQARVFGLDAHLDYEI